MPDEAKIEEAIQSYAEAETTAERLVAIAMLSRFVVDGRFVVGQPVPQCKVGELPNGIRVRYENTNTEWVLERTRTTSEWISTSSGESQPAPPDKRISYGLIVAGVPWDVG